MSKIVNLYNNKKIFILLIIFVLLSNLIINSSIANEENLLPNLSIKDIDVPTKMTEGMEVELIVEIENIGDKNITNGEIIEVGLFLDYSSIPVAYNSSDNGLTMEGSCFINLSWTPTISDNSDHVISITVNYNQLVIENNYEDNSNDILVFFTNIDTNLEIINFDIEEMPKVNQTVNIIAQVKNTGKKTDEDIIARLNSSIEGNIQNLTKENGLEKDETYSFTFTWTPNYFGSQILSVEIMINETIYDTEEITALVDVGLLRWWNENWHYRQFVIVKGVGNVLKDYNFSEFLNDLGLINKTFESDTYRIIEYAIDGEIIGEIDLYYFDKTEDFDPIYNAEGDLIWNAISSSEEKYFCIYFDVENNTGSRSINSETSGMQESGNASITYSGIVNNWYAEVIKPVTGSYSLIENPINIEVETTAKAENVTAFIYYSENISHNFSIYLKNSSNQTFWYYENIYFDLEGNWTIRIYAYDGACFIPTYVEQEFYVGKPDLELIFIGVSSEWPYYSGIIYTNDTVNISSYIISQIASVEEVNVSISITDKSINQEVFSQIIQKSFIKDENTSVFFNWTVNKSGEFNVKISVDSSNIINESDESNNIKNVDFTVYDWPDLKVESIILPTSTLQEFNKVKIETTVSNIGECNASNYEVRLYIEPDSTIMKYETEKDSLNVSIDAGTSKKISLYWDSAEQGSWIVGVKIIVGFDKKDSNLNNNRLLSNEKLIIRSIERNPPKIKNIAVTPSDQQQGGRVIITANISDDTGLESVEILIFTPSGLFYNGPMVRTTDDRFKYTFDETSNAGTYNFTITVIDISIHKNSKSVEGDFTIYKDNIDPILSYIYADPPIQLKGKGMNIICIASDNIGLHSVRIKIYPPNNLPFNDELILDKNGKYIYRTSFVTTGKYNFKITVEDFAGNYIISEEKTFWITTNLEDSDNDGMPDDWEKRFNLNPYNPDDAKEDIDGDGFTNLEEYQMGSHPEKDIFLQNIASRIKDNSSYLLGSIIVFILILIFAIYGKRRKS